MFQSGMSRWIRKQMKNMIAVRPAAIGLFVYFVLSGMSYGQSDSAIDFVRDVRPIFEKNCYECHSGDHPSSSFRLDHKASAFAGGELYGNKIIPQNGKESLLLQFVRDENHEMRMPPEGDMLSTGEVEIIRRWIDQGAVWPEGIDQIEIADPRDHWAFKPLQANHELLRHIAADHVNEGVDRSLGILDLFIERKLREVGLKSNENATRRDWLKRVTFDLTGLPPSLEEIRAFEDCDSLDAYEQVVDRLLCSPRYGERAAQHWLDVVRYADTHGFEVNTERPHAWPYRDYVINAFNEDTPYNEFIRQQLIGDQIGHDSATGFLVTASVLLPGQIGQDEPSKRLARQDALDEIVVNIGQTILGLTIGCARCHNHKFDPISQIDYFAMQAFVAGVEYEDRLVHDEEASALNESLRFRLEACCRHIAKAVPAYNSDSKRPSVNARHNIDRFLPQTVDRIRFTILSTNRLEPCIDELQVYDTMGRNVAIASKGAIVTASGSNTFPDRHELRFVNDGKYGNSKSWMSNEDGKGWIEIRFSEAFEIDRVEWGRDRYSEFGDRLAVEYTIEGANGADEWFRLSDHTDREAYDENARRIPVDSKLLVDDSISHLLSEYESLLVELKKHPEGGRPVFAGVFRKPDDIHLLRRGDPEQPQQPVLPAVPNLLGNLALERDADDPTRRQVLADWISRDDNPLTARVIVNRVWQSHFGVGIVETSNDFGRNGARPTHPELLDYLAQRLVASGWSLKALHREIVLSATYRQSSAPNPKGDEVDSEGKYLWRFPLRRLEGEAVRDALLSSAGQLSLTMGGTGYDLFDKRGGLSGFEPIERLVGANNRRMIYAHRVRRERDAIFGAFDCPDGGQSTPRRRESTTPIQALNLLNSTMVIELSQMLAKVAESSVPGDRMQQVALIYGKILGREPRSDELERIQPIVEKHGLAAICRALFNSNEYIYIR